MQVRKEWFCILGIHIGEMDIFFLYETGQIFGVNKTCAVGEKTFEAPFGSMLNLEVYFPSFTEYC